jgi:hypothetical protein
MRKVGRQIVGDSVGEIVLLLVAAQVLERQHDDRKPRRVGKPIVKGRGHETRRIAGTPREGPDGKKRGDAGCDHPDPTTAATKGPQPRRLRPLVLRPSDFQRGQRISSHWPRDVLELSLAEVDEILREPVAHLPVGVFGDTDAARLANAFPTERRY